MTGSLNIYRRTAGMMLAAVLLAGCDGNEQASQQPPVPVVKTVAVQPSTMPLVNDLPGRIAPIRIAEVRPRVSGILVERVFNQGTVVRAGDILYRLDAAPFRVKVDSAKAALQRATAARVLAKQQADRQTQLRERDVTTGQLYDKAIAELAQAVADEASARAGLEAAELDLKYTEVRAPITGRIGRALITEGALVTMGNDQVLAKIQQLEPVYADFTQSANELLNLKNSAQSGDGGDVADVTLRFDDGSDYPHHGRLLFSEAAVDETTGQITLRGEFPNPDGDLLPGMYVRVQIVQGVMRDALSVPQRAVQRDAGGQATLYVVNADRKVEVRKVTTGRLLGDNWIIADGLNSGDQVVVEGFQSISPGIVVEPKTWQRLATVNSTTAKQDGK